MTDSERRNEYGQMLEDFKELKDKLACLENKKRGYYYAIKLLAEYWFAEFDVKNDRIVIPDRDKTEVEYLDKSDMIRMLRDIRSTRARLNSLEGTLKQFGLRSD